MKIKILDEHIPGNENIVRVEINNQVCIKDRKEVEKLMRNNGK